MIGLIESVINMSWWAKYIYNWLGEQVFSFLVSYDWLYCIVFKN